MTARTAADLVGVNKTTAACFYHRLREIIAWRLDEASPLAGEVQDSDQQEFAFHLPLNGRTMEFDGDAKCVKDC